MHASEHQIDPVMQVLGLRKSYGPTNALGGVSFQIRPGEVHALLGENGAGKSTLVKILTGVVSPDHGSMTFKGAPYSPRSILQARAAGVTTAFQELSLLPNLTVAENLALPRLLKNWTGLNSDAKSCQAAAATLLRFGLRELNPSTLVSELTLADRQRLEIVRALSHSPSLLILDEPTAVLPSTDWLFDLIKKETAKGTAVLYISHRLNEIRQLCTQATVLRSGCSIKTTDLHDTDDSKIFEMMVGQRMDSKQKQSSDEANKFSNDGPRLRVRGLDAGMVKGLDLDLYPGQIVGLAGLDGQGQCDLFHALYGLIHKRSGTTEIEGKTVTIRSPAEALSAGVQVALLPEERKTQGIFGDLAVRSNIVMSALGRVGSMGFTSRKNERKLATDIAGPVDLQDRYLEFQIKDLSGGNQQKALLGRVLLTGARILLLFDPTRGVDVGTKQALYTAIEDFVRGGGAVLLYSSELAELVRLSDRCLVIYEGRIAAELVGDAIQETALVAAATGHSHHSAGAVA
ncbi:MULTISPECIES: sugar ABC transporter ATP-binding protein [Pseudomonas]|uniref:ATP-binding cassette domain-containing protein n=1 Tax=Pseudomonas putida TaxID=303 RepID=A0A7V8E9Z6_PSEPU|nr:MULTISPECIES: sugar ABC transporter ATP-binding protein [Pseudomonas]KAF0251005.1 ATP-binding cassette domain-containing protein [Pseudomonas putida]MBL7228286.1 sugar ABC transporter ATP-binding protein [Pseudomonas sp.]